MLIRKWPGLANKFKISQDKIIKYQLTQPYSLFKICRNGLLQFDSQWLPWWPYNFGERWWLKKEAMLAPYWGLTDTDDSFVIQGFSKVNYHVYSDSDPSSAPMLKRASSDTKRLLSTPLPTAFKASGVLVVTWRNLRPYQYPANMANQVKVWPILRTHKLFIGS